MNRIFSCVLFFLSVFVFSAFPQDQPKNNKNRDSDDRAKRRAEDIIAKSLETTGFSGAQENLHMVFTETRYVQSREFTTEKELSISLPYKMRWLSTGRLYVLSSVLDKTSYRKRYDSTGANPQSVNRDVNLTPEEQQKDHDVRLLKWKSFLVFFPVILHAPWYPKIEFRHVGIAQSPNGKADILEAKVSKTRKHQLLFDTESHLLLLWKIISTTKENTTKRIGFLFFRL